MARKGPPPRSPEKSPTPSAPGAPPPPPPRRGGHRGREESHRQSYGDQFPHGRIPPSSSAGEPSGFPGEILSLVAHTTSGGIRLFNIGREKYPEDGNHAEGLPVTPRR